MEADDLVADVEEDDVIAEPADITEREVERRDGGQRAVDRGPRGCGRVEGRLGLVRDMRQERGVEADAGSQADDVVDDRIRRYDGEERPGTGSFLGTCDRHRTSLAKRVVGR